MRVLGLDISKDAISCVEVETAFGRFEVRETHEISIASDAAYPEHNPMITAAQMLDQVGATPHQLVTSIPVELATFRNLNLATRDKKAIKAALEFELEDDLPFERENLHYDSAILESSTPGSLIHIGAAKKETFDHYLKQLQENGMDPDIITTDAWAYRCLFSRLSKTLPKGEGQDPILLLGFERNKTFFYVNSKNRPVLYREIPFGIKTIESKLNETLGASSEELRSWIKDIGVSGIDEQVSNAISDVLEILVPELKQTELSARAQEKIGIEKIYITGEGALMPGFTEWLEVASGKSVTLFKPLSFLSNAKVSYSDVTEVRFAKALALAMTMIPTDRLQPINFRKGFFAKLSATANSPLELIKKPLPYLMALLLIFFVTKTVEYNYYKGKLSESEESLKKGVKSYFGGISDNAARSYLSDIGKLKKTVERDLAKERELSKLLTPNANSPLDLLKALSQKIGKDVVLDLVSFDSGSDYNDKFVENKPIRTTLTFMVTNPQAIAKLSETLEKNFAFKKGTSEELKHEGHSVYKVTYAGTLGSGK